MFLKIIIYCVLLIYNDVVEAGYCTSILIPGGGIANFNIIFRKKINTILNKSGSIIPIHEWNLGITNYIKCDCNGNDSFMQIYYKDSILLEKTNIYHVNGKSMQFFKIHDGIQLALEISIDNLMQYINLPFNRWIGDNIDKRYCLSSISYAGGTGRIYLFLDKPIIGSVYLQTPQLFSLYANTQSDGRLGGGSEAGFHYEEAQKHNIIQPFPVAKFSLYGDISVPQICTLEPRNITIDFGLISSDTLSTSFNNKSHSKKQTFHIQCTNYFKSNILHISLESDINNYNKTLFATDKKNIGIQILDSNGKIILPTPIGIDAKKYAKIPVSIDNNLKNSGFITIEAFPVKTTNNVEFGKFNGVATLKVEFL